MERDSLKRYLEVIYNRCYRILQNSDMAWDALQEVFALYYEACKKKDIEHPLSYLYRSSTNHCLNVLRQRKKYVPLITEVLEKNIDETRKAESRILVDSLVDEFGKDAIDLLIYRYLDKMTLKEMAAIYQISDRGMKKRLDRLETQIQKYCRG